MSLQKPNAVREYSIYGSLFQLASEELERCGMSMPCSQKSFEAVTGAAPQTVDLLPLLRLEGKEFADALWFAFFQKLPPKKEQKRFAECSKEEILKMASGEGAFAIRGIKPINSPFKIKIGFRGQILKVISGVKSSVFLRKLAKKMPDGLQKKIRKLFC